jgi:hypothetical protein
MEPCASGILMAALTLALVLVDFYHFRLDYAGQHALLGGIISILFFAMCNYGLEMINWIVLAIIPVYVVLTWYFSSKEHTEHTDNSEDCADCEEESCFNEEKEKEKKKKKTCSSKKISNTPDEDYYKVPRINCPAKPLRLGTQCGISRAT